MKEKKEVYFYEKKHKESRRKVKNTEKKKVEKIVRADNKISRNGV